MSAFGHKSFEEKSNVILGGLLALIIAVLVASAALPNDYGIGERIVFELSDNTHLPAQTLDAEGLSSAGEDIVPDSSERLQREALVQSFDQNAILSAPAPVVPELADTDTPNTGLSEIDFNLADFVGGGAVPNSGSGDQIEVRKSLIADGRDLGTLTVTIDKYAQLHAAPSELRDVLAETDNANGLNRLGNGQLVSFARLRDTGIDLRYDPIADVITLGS